MSLYDKAFINMCKDIIVNGHSSVGENVRAVWEDGTPAHTTKKFGVVTRYNLAKEFPASTLRPINLKAAVDELLWIYQKKSNNVKDLNSKIWNQWSSSDGSIGTCYGYIVGKKFKFKNNFVDQTDYILKLLKEDKQSRRMVISLFNHEFLHSGNLDPCCWSITFNVSGKKLNAVLNQRSQDVLVANNWNVAQYAILVYMFAQVSGLEAGELIHVIADAHIYDRHIPLVEELIKREQYNAPKLWINPEIKDFYKFTVDDFKLIDYKAGEQIKNIPVAV